MAMMLVKAERTFTGGVLQGLTILQQWREDAQDAPKPGTTRIVFKPYGGSSPYRDYVVAVEPVAQ